MKRAWFNIKSGKAAVSGADSNFVSHQGKGQGNKRRIESFYISQRCEAANHAGCKGKLNFDGSRIACECSCHL